MSVCLKWITPDAERVIVDCARVSSDPNAHHASDDRLIGYLIRNAHWSPLEMANACIQIRTTRDIARQILRHRSLVFQEFSQRYQDVSILGDPSYREARMQHPTNRQASTACEDGALATWWDIEQERVWTAAEGAYQRALQAGVAKEVARAVLPEGLAPTRLYANGTIRSWVHFVTLREGNGSQPEVQEIARQIGDILGHHLPAVMAGVREAA
ncbi:MAG: FAD-dependent thymidylate synthase [Celeribacter sp.]|jgi:thymidylate synthase (FAD)